MSGGIEVEVDLAPLEAMFSEAAMARAREELTLGVMQSVQSDGDNPEGGFAPYRTGHLHQSCAMTGEDEFTYTEGYASYVYNGTSRQKGQPWFEWAKARRLDAWRALAVDCAMGGAS